MTTLERSTVPVAGRFLPEIRQLAWRGVVWAVVYGLFARGSRGGCVDLESAPRPGVEQDCFEAVVSPSPLVWLVMAVVFVVALSRSMRKTDARDVARVFTIASWMLFLIPIIVGGLTLWWFLATPPDAFLDGYTPPFIDVRLDPSQIQFG
jgi:amino acid transporter